VFVPSHAKTIFNAWAATTTFLAIAISQRLHAQGYAVSPQTILVSKTITSLAGHIVLASEVREFPIDAGPATRDKKISGSHGSWDWAGPVHTSHGFWKCVGRCLNRRAGKRLGLS